MTNREAQIFQWISENPMISQEELAARAGITRSSVAVHISNLMKKGYIQGKGYITGSPDYFVVLGAVNIDIGGYPAEAPIDCDSNPGSVSISYGGVGRNIAHNIRLLDLPVKFITAFGDDYHATGLTEHLTSLGIDISDSLRTKDAQTSTYLFITDEKGDMKLAVSDMRIYDYLTPEYLAGKMDSINHARALILDTNLSAETIAYVAEHCTVPILADPVSCKKAGKLAPVLGHIHSLCPNRLEAEVLSGISIRDDADLKKAASILLSYGVKRLFITLGSKGIYCTDGSEELLLPPLASDLVNTTGAGDAFTASLAYSLEAGFSLQETVQFGLAASAIAVESRETINPKLCRELVLARSGLAES
ncbi:MAG: PfkB family carbohydrate kinase [Lachnospiraceae bacterium]